jgi:hypothetical protein
MNDDVVAPLQRFVEAAPLCPAPFALGFAFLLPLTNLSQPAVEHDLHVQGVRELCDEALEGGQLGSVDDDKFHGWVPRATATPMPRQIVRKYARLSAPLQIRHSGLLVTAQIRAHLTTESVTSTRIVSPVMGSAAVVSCEVWPSLRTTNPFVLKLRNIGAPATAGEP